MSMARPSFAGDAAGVIACGSGALRLVEVQRAGGRPMAADLALRGLKLAAGDRLG